MLNTIEKYTPPPPLTSVNTRGPIPPQAPAFAAPGSSFGDTSDTPPPYTSPQVDVQLVVCERGFAASVEDWGDAEDITPDGGGIMEPI